MLKNWLARTESQGLKLVWDASYEKAKLFHFKIDSIERKENLHKIRLAERKAIKSDIEGEEMVQILGRIIKVMNVAVVNNTHSISLLIFRILFKRGKILMVLFRLVSIEANLCGGWKCFKGICRSSFVRHQRN